MPNIPNINPYQVSGFGLGNTSPGLNPYSGAFSLAGPPPPAYGGGGGMSMSYPGPSSGGGGMGSLGGILSTIGGGLMGTNPVGLGIMGIGNALTGIFGAINASKRQRKSEKWMKENQQNYISQMDRIFPEMSREQMTFNNPYQGIAQAGLGYRLGNMFSNWGMPEGMRQGSDSINDLFAGLINNASFNPYQTAGNIGFGQQPNGGFGGGGRMPTGIGRGRRDVNAYAQGGIVRQPQYALVGEAGPEAIVPLEKNANRRFKQRSPQNREIANRLQMQGNFPRRPQMPQRPVIQPYNPNSQGFPMPGSPNVPAGWNPYGRQQFAGGIF